MSWLSEVHDQYLDELKRSGEPLPVQSDRAQRLDRAVINFGVSILEASGIPVRGIIGAFREGRPVFTNSALYSHSHVQIAVRDLSLITDYHILPPNEVPDVRKIEHSSRTKRVKAAEGDSQLRRRPKQRRWPSKVGWASPGSKN